VKKSQILRRVRSAIVPLAKNSNPFDFFINHQWEHQLTSHILQRHIEWIVGCCCCTLDRHFLLEPFDCISRTWEPFGQHAVAVHCDELKFVTAGFSKVQRTDRRSQNLAARSQHSLPE